MGNFSYLTGTSHGGPHPIKDSLDKLESTSILFRDAWERVPPEMDRAARISAKAMGHLDHIVNEILRARDTSKARRTYAGSQLEAELGVMRGMAISPVTAEQQQAMIAAGPGHGRLPGQASQITLQRLLNKIKHRHHQSANFRIQAGRHIFVFNVDTPDKTPDSIAEFDVAEFCAHCSRVAKHL